MDEHQFDTLSKKVDTLQSEHAKLDTRLSLIEQDIKGNGVPGMKSIVNDIDKKVEATNTKLDAFIKRFDEWMLGSPARANTCFYLRSAEKKEKKWVSVLKWIAAIIGILTFLMLAIPDFIQFFKGA